MKVIFTSDDYGLTAGITRQISDAWEQGLLNGFSVVANGDALPEGVARLRARENLEARIAVHLNLYEGTALASPDQVPLIIDSNGYLRNSFLGLLLRWTISSPAKRLALVNQVEKEWRCQIERVRDMISPRRISALDGHLHFHMLPFLFPVALSLAEEFGIGEIRVTREPFYFSADAVDHFSPAFFVNILKNMVLNVCSRNVRKSLDGSRIRHTDAFVGVLFSGRMTKASANAGIARCRRSGARSVEVLFHVGRATAEEMNRWADRPEAAAFQISPMRDREYAALEALRAESEG